MSMVTPLVEGPLIDNVNTTTFEKSHQLLRIPFHQAQQRKTKVPLNLAKPTKPPSETAEKGRHVAGYTLTD